MQALFSWPWVEAQVARTVEVWNKCATVSVHTAPRYSQKEQQKREKAYDRELRAVEREVRKVPRTKTERLKTQDRITSSFGRFSATALGLEEEAVQLLTNDFLPVGTTLAQWARQFDAALSMDDIVQACRNAWTACGLQPLLGDRIGITPSILGYSLLYPYSDNYLDRAHESAEAKLRFSARFRDRLRGIRISPENDRENAVWALIALIEGQYPRFQYPQVFHSLLAIHRAQEESIAQLSANGHSTAELLRISCAKGGSSVLADACLAHGWLNEQESCFSFQWGVLLQLGDDLQDVRDDLEHGSATLFSDTVAMGKPLDDLVTQLLNFSDQVGVRMDNLPHATAMLKDLLRMSWRSLILGAVAESHDFFSSAFLNDVESSSPFRFEFLRARRERLTRRQGLQATLFDAFLEPREDGPGELPSPDCRTIFNLAAEAESIADVTMA